MSAHASGESPLVFDRFVRYDELASSLDALAEAFPDLVTVESVRHVVRGSAAAARHRHRPRPPGAPETKPAHWVDANIHATEVTGGAAALHLVHHLVTAAERGDAATAAGAADAHVLRRAARQPRRCGGRARRHRRRYRRSSMRPWPYADAAPVARPARPGHRRRRSCADDADRRPERRVDPASRRTAG